MNYKTAVLKRNIELAGMFPFVLLGRLLGILFPLKTRHRIFLFFPSADIGGSPKANADITDCIKHEKPLIIFTKKPKNNQFWELFAGIEGVRILDIHNYVDNKLYHFVNFIFRGIIASWVNAADHPVIFGGESMYFYKVLPHVKKQTQRIELCHLNTWFNFSQAFVKYIDIRIFSSPQIKRDVERQYEMNGVPGRYLKKLLFVDNKVDIPELKHIENPVLEVVFIGRGAPQKRVHLIAAIARKMHQQGARVHFSFVGDVDGLVPDEAREYCTFYGNIRDKAEMNRIYDNSDVLLLTSAFEGLPIVVMDMMARGKVVISTAVGGIPDYITHNRNGLLIDAKEENGIVDQGVEYINFIANNKEVEKEIGKNSYEYAREHFSGEKFCSTYRRILLSGKASFVS